MTTNQKMDIDMLVQNLNDLDDISQRVSNEMDYKNRILEEGLIDCEQCKTKLKNLGNKQKQHNETQPTSKRAMY